MSGYNQKSRDDNNYEKMVARCEIHNEQVETITRMATPKENEKYLKIIEEEQRKLKLENQAKLNYYNSLLTEYNTHANIGGSK